MRIENEGRRQKLEARKRKHTGGSFAAQFKRMEINQGYARIPQGNIQVRVFSREPG